MAANDKRMYSAQHAKPTIESGALAPSHIKEMEECDFEHLSTGASAPLRLHETWQRQNKWYQMYQPDQTNKTKTPEEYVAFTYKTVTHAYENMMVAGWLAGDDGVSGVHIPCLSVMNAYMICFLLLMMPIYWIRFCVRLVFILFRPSFPFFCLSVRNFVCFSLILLRKYACFIVNDSVSAVILSCRTWTEKTRRSLTSSTFSPGFRADQPTVNHFNIWSFVL